MWRYHNFFNWQEQLHLTTMPDAAMTLEQRIARMPGQVFGTVADEAIALAPKREEHSGKTFEITVAWIPLRSLASLTLVQRVANMTLRIQPGLAHLIELASQHREIFRRYDRVYGLGGVRPAGDGETVYVPYVESKFDSEGGYLVIGERRVRPDARSFTTDEGDHAFAMMDPPLPSLAAVVCHGCTQV